MKSVLAIFGSVVGWLGVAVCLTSGGAKLFGSYYILDYESMTVFIAGIGLIATGCLAKLEASATPHG